MTKTSLEKKVILVLVEGPSDETSLGTCLRNVFNQKKVLVKVLHCDITTREGVNSTTIRGELGSVLKAFLTNNPGLRKKDICRIIHIIDTDGAFISNVAIVENLLIEKTEYSEQHIYTACKKLLELRNEKKRNVVNILVKTKALLEIPYNVYFMSCNLEHVLHNKINCTNKEKRFLAEQFDDKYSDCVDDFKHFIEASSFSVGSSYEESWDLIRSDGESLRRHTNLSLCWKEKP